MAHGVSTRFSGARMRTASLRVDVPIVFRERPVPVAGVDRVPWRLAALALTLRRCRRNQTAVAAVHVLMWALSSARSRGVFLAWWSGRRSPVTSTFRFDPQVDSTIDLALGSGLVRARASGRLQLTDAGVTFADAILATDDLLATERAFLDELPRSIAESEIRRRLGWDSR
jgi:hypothetical protein